MGVISETLVVNGAQKAAEDLRQVGTAADGASKSLHGPKGMSTGLASVTQQLPDVITQLAGGANVLQVVAQQGLQVVQANQSLMASLTPLLPALGALAAIAGEIYVAYRVLNMEETEAAAVADVVAGATQNLVNWTDIQRQATLDLAEATGELSAAEVQRARNAIEMQKQWLQSTADLRAKAAELRKEQDSLTTQAVDLVGSALEVVDVFGVNSMIFDAFTTDSAELQTQLDAVNGVISQQTEEARKTTEAMNKASDAKDKATRSSRAHKDALDAEIKAEKERQASLEEIVATEEQFAAVERKAAEDRMAADAEARAIEQQKALRARETSMAAVQASGLADSFSGPLAQFGGLSGLLQGGAAKALNVVLPPPWGQIASGLVGLLSGGGAGAVQGMLQGVVDAVMNVLTGLPDLLMGLMDFLPTMLIQIIEGLAPLVEGLLAGAGELVVELIDALPSLIVALLQAVPDIIAALVRGLGVLVVDLVHAIIVDLPQALVELFKGILGLNGAAFGGIGSDVRREWGRSGGGWRKDGGGGITIQGGVVGDGWRLGEGLARVFDRDHGRHRGRM
jgi:phage-related protein